MAENKMIAVFRATGAGGGGLVRAIMADDIDGQAGLAIQALLRYSARRTDRTVETQGRYSKGCRLSFWHSAEQKQPLRTTRTADPINRKQWFTAVDCCALCARCAS